MGSLGSLAHSMSDKFLRENFRRIVTGTGMSVASIVEGKQLLDARDWPKRILLLAHVRFVICSQTLFRQVNAQ